MSDFLDISAMQVTNINDLTKSRKLYMACHPFSPFPALSQYPVPEANILKYLVIDL